MSAKTTTILLADDHAVVRSGFRRILDTEWDLEVVGEAANGREAVEMAEKLKPMVVVMDVTMPELNGLAVMELIRARYPQIPVIICSAHKERSVILDAKKRGANDYLLKPFTSEVLFQKLRQHTSPSFYG